MHMQQGKIRSKVEHLLSLADVKTDGDRPWDLRVHNEQFYPSVMTGGSLALGETYMAGWWDCERLDEFFYRIFRQSINEKVRPGRDLLYRAGSFFYNFQKPSRAFQVGEHHYDLGNDLYEKMLDKRMMYSCAYWKDAKTLDSAQESKLDLVCRKLKILPGMRVLDIGCGWGGAAKFIAERCGAEVVGITVSRQQLQYARKLCQGLPVDIRIQDYRCLDEKFDRILSIGMFEHVGYKNYPVFMRCVRKNLFEDGIFLLHTIGGNRSVTRIDPWLNRYIFPNAMLPSKKQISKAVEGLFVMEDWHNFGVDYDRTLMAWVQNFRANRNALGDAYGTSFDRMWEYYLLSCAGSFRARRTHLWQIVFSPQGVLGGYDSPR
jgi:cyclopropane-fatty-acyl-phospholipid synthase